MTALLTVLIWTGATAPAQATVENYCDTFLSAYDTCVGDRHSIVRNGVFSPSGNRVCAGARRGDDYSFYGSYICGYTNAEHCYSGDRLLYPLAHNGMSFGQSLRGQMTYPSGPCPA